MNRCTRKRGPKAPERKTGGDLKTGADLPSSQKNLDSSRMRNEIRMCSVVHRERNYLNTQLKPTIARIGLV